MWASSRAVSSSSVLARSPISSLRSTWPKPGRGRAAVRQRERRVTQADERPDERRRHQQPDDDGGGKRCDDDFEDTQANLVERLQDAERRLRHERDADNAVAVTDRDCAVECQRTLARCRPHIGAIPPFERGAKLRPRRRIGRAVARGGA